MTFLPIAKNVARALCALRISRIAGVSSGLGPSSIVNHTSRLDVSKVVMMSPKSGQFFQSVGIKKSELAASANACAFWFEPVNAYRRALPPNDAVRIHAIPRRCLGVNITRRELTLLPIQNENIPQPRSIKSVG